MRQRHLALADRSQDSVPLGQPLPAPDDEVYWTCHYCGGPVGAVTLRCELCLNSQP